MASNTLVEAEIWTLAQTEQGNVVLVRPKGSQLAVPIFIGQLETQAILIGIGHVEMPRPLTHDLFLQALGQLGATINRIEINDLREGTFYARIILTRGEESFVLDARPSDAIGLSVRTLCPVFIAEDIVDQAGISVKLVNDAVDRGETLEPEQAMSERKRLERDLEAAIAGEDYERAALIRDKIQGLED